MKLANNHGETFEMTVSGYQFPHLDSEPFDSDWLAIEFNVKHARGAWSKTDPCMLTWEVAELAAWFETIAGANPSYSEKHFMEPELSFEWNGFSRSLRVHLHYGLRPSWSPYYGPNEENDLYVEFSLTPEIATEIARSLRNDLKRFPVRVPM